MRKTRYIPGVVLLCAIFAVGCSSRQAILSDPGPQTPAADAININTATVDELQRLPHVGRKTAEAIVEFRNVNGPFRRPEYLMQIRGISETRFGEMRPHIKTE